MTSVDFSTFFRRLLTTNRRFLKLGSFCPEVRPFLAPKLSYFAPFFVNASQVYGEIAGFLSWAHFPPKLGIFCPEVRPNSPLKLDSKY